MTTMTAIGAFAAKPIDDDGALQDVTVEVPALRPRDVLSAGLQPSSTPAFLGYDAAGIVEAGGPQVETLSVADEVWYSGDLTLQGSISRR